MIAREIWNVSAQDSGESQRAEERKVDSSFNGAERDRPKQDVYQSGEGREA